MPPNPVDVVELVMVGKVMVRDETLAVEFADVERVMTQVPPVIVPPKVTVAVCAIALMLPTIKIAAIRPFLMSKNFMLFPVKS